MIEQTLLSDSVVPVDFMNKALKAITSSDIQGLLSELPIVPDDEFAYDDENPTNGWRPRRFHWVPVGRERVASG